VIRDDGQVRVQSFGEVIALLLARHHSENVGCTVQLDVRRDERTSVLQIDPVAQENRGSRRQRNVFIDVVIGSAGKGADERTQSIHRLRLGR
jgi:hypothetical protein